MKLKKYIGLFMFSLVIFVSCEDSLDPWEYTLVTEDKAFELTTYLEAMASSAYSYVPAGFNRIGNSYMAAATDESEEVNDIEAIQAFNSGSWNKYNNPDDVWANMYKGIRVASDYLNGTDTLTWWNVRYPNPTVYGDRITKLCRNRGEMHFLRAYYYYELIKRYGEVPLIKDKVDVANVDISKYGRAPIDSIVEFIVKECDICTSRGAYALTKAQIDTLMKYNKNALPSPYRDTLGIYYGSTGVDATRQGRATLGAAIGLKAKALLLAASPQFNSKSADNPTGDQAKWRRAAAACYEVIKLTKTYPSYYSLSTSYSGLFQPAAWGTWNNEYLFARKYTSTNAFDAANFPVSIPGGKTGNCPTADFVDSYENKDGTPFSWEKFKTAFDAAKLKGTALPSPFDNRDYRLKMTVLTNNASWNSVSPLQCWVDATGTVSKSGSASPLVYKGSKTSFYLAKYVNQTLDLTQNNTSAKWWSVMRIGEFYLSFAEAMNEGYGPEVDAGFGMTALTAVNTIRRTGRNDIKNALIPSGKTQAQFRDIVRQERRVELAFEDVRYWDLRRWLTAEKFLNGPIRGLKIVKLSDKANDFSYVLDTVETRVFDPSKMYLHPIPRAEIDKAAGVLIQNPNW